MKVLARLFVFLLMGASMVAYSQEKIDLLILNKNFNAALQQIDNQLNKQPRAELYLKKGLVYNQLQDYDDALKAFAEAQKLAPNNPEVLQELAEAHAVLGNYIDALPYYERAYRLEIGRAHV